MKRNRFGELQRAASDVIVTNKGARTGHMLSNGSKVWVNVSRRLTYDHTFDAKTRTGYGSGRLVLKGQKTVCMPFTATITPEINESV